MVTLFHLLAIGGYLVATSLLVRSLIRSGRTGFAWITVAIVAGAAAHFVGILSYAVEFGELPLHGLGPVLTSIGFLIGAGSLLLTLFERGGPVGIVLLPVAALSTLAAILAGLRPAAAEITFAGAWFTLHVSLAAVAYACLAVAFAAGLMYILQFRQLKGKHFGRVFRFFPPLETLDRMGGGAILIGWITLSVALVLGGARAVTAGMGWDPWDPHLVWGVLTWLVFGGVLALRAGPRRSGFRAAAASVGGFAVVVLAYLVLRTQVSAGSVFL